jgi:predicted AlkP superfamily phosphohydrolase/phosphomutase
MRYYSQEELEERFPYHGKSNTFSEVLGRIVRRLKLNDTEWDQVIEYMVELYDRRKLAAHNFLKEKYPLMDEATIEEMTKIFIDNMPMSPFDTESDLYNEKFVEEYNKARGWQ